MNISLIDQQLACIKAIKTQLDNGYHISEADRQQFIEAVDAITEIADGIKKQLQGES